MIYMMYYKCQSVCQKMLKNDFSIWETPTRGDEPRENVHLPSYL